MAASHAACKNSSLVSTSPLALAETASGSTITNLAEGKKRVIGPKFGDSTGASDSIPATGIPSEILVSISVRFGNSRDISLAFEATAGVISISLAGYKSMRSMDPGIDL